MNFHLFISKALKQKSHIKKKGFGTWACADVSNWNTLIRFKVKAYYLIKKFRSKFRERCYIMWTNFKKSLHLHIKDELFTYILLMYSVFTHVMICKRQKNIFCCDSKIRFFLIVKFSLNCSFILHFNKAHLNFFSDFVNKRQQILL